MLIEEALPADAPTLAQLISESNRDVARQFGLDQNNCPKHPSFCTPDWVRADLARGERYFLMTRAGQAVGCIAYERVSPALAYLNRLSVIPSYRCQGAGQRLVTHVLDHARADGAAAVSIGIIGEHDALQTWYARLGFEPGELKRFAHLPFSVRYMAYRLCRE